MTLEKLYPLISEAIQRAEALEDAQSAEARLAYQEVSILEEQVAGLLAAAETEGLLARRGAVRAAILAQDIDRATQLLSEYEAESREAFESMTDLVEMRDNQASIGVKEPTPSP